MHENVQCTKTRNARKRGLRLLRGLRCFHGAMQVAAETPQTECFYATRTISGMIFY